MTNQAFRRRKEVIEADTKTNLLNDFIRVFGIDIIFNGLSRIFTKILWGDLDKVRDLGLRNVRIRKPWGDGDLRLTRMNMAGFETVMVQPP